MGPIACPEKLLRNYHCALHDIPEESEDLIYSVVEARNHSQPQFIYVNIIRRLLLVMDTQFYVS